MPWRDFVTGSQKNRVVAVGGATGVIVAAAAGLIALQIEDPAGNNGWLFSAYGVPCVGEPADCGELNEVLINQGGSGVALAWGPQSGGGGGDFGTGNVISVGDPRYVNVSGDTMTGALVIDNEGAEPSLNVKGTASGSIVHAEKVLTSSGTFAVEGTSDFHGDIDMNAVNITEMGNITFKTGAQGGTLRTGTSNADTYQLQGYDVNDGVYRNVFQVHAGNTVTFEFNEDGADMDFRAEGATDQNLLFLDASTDRVGLGTNSPETKLDVQGTISGASLVVSDLLSCENLQTAGNGAFSCNTTDYITEVELDTEAELEAQLTDVTNVFTNNDGALNDDNLSDNTTDDLPQGSTNLYSQWINTASPIEYVGTASGTKLHASTVLSSSGTLSILGAFYQSGLPDCDNAGEKPTYDLTTGKWGCGTDDELTEEEVEDFVGGMLGGTETHITVTYQDSTNDIDFVVDPDSVAGAISAGSLADGIIREPDLDADNAANDGDVLTYDSTGTNFAWITPTSDLTADLIEEAELDSFSELQTQISDKTLVNEEDAVTWDSAHTFNSTITANGLVRGTASPYSFSGNSLILSDLTSCDTIDTTASGVLICGTDAGAGAALSRSEADNIYVNQAGDTMTGGLLIQDGDPAGTIEAGLLLEILGTASGRTIRASNVLTSSGSLSIEGTAAIGGATTAAALSATSLTVSGNATISGILSGATLVVSDLKSCNTIDTDDTGALVCGTDEGGAGTPGGADTNVQFNESGSFGGDVEFVWNTTSKVLEVVGTSSGSTVHASNSLTSSGSLSVAGAILAATLSTDGGIVYSDGTQLQNTVAGTSGQVLVSQGISPPNFASQELELAFVTGENGVSTGTSVSLRYRAPRAMTIVDVRMDIKNAPLGSSLIVDLNENGTTLFSTRPEIDAGAFVEDDNHVFTDTAIAAGGLITLDVDQVGSSQQGTGLTVVIRATEP